MKTIHTIISVGAAMLLASGACWAYGGGGPSSTKVCTKPKFGEYLPAENIEAPAGAAFSFTASANTLPSSIKVTVKTKPVHVNVTPKKTGSFEVSGKLPAQLKGTFARISVSAEAQHSCYGTGGWLVKIGE